MLSNLGSIALRVHCSHWNICMRMDLRRAHCQYKLLAVSSLHNQSHKGSQATHPTATRNLRRGQPAQQI